MTPILLSTLVLLVFSLCVNSAQLKGGPGAQWDYDQYNVGDWNRTYGITEPQQIHISISSQAEYAKVQFATQGEVHTAILNYWPKSSPHKSIVIEGGENWAFVDNGTAHHTIYLHNLQTLKLKPATVFQYKVGTKDSHGKVTWSKGEFEFHTARRGNTVNFVATADLGLVNAVAMPALQRLAKSHKYDFLTLSGDQAYDMADFNGTKGDEYMRFAENLFANIPFMGAVGNHENAYNFSHWKNRFNNVPFQKSGFSNPMQYSYDYKSLHIVAWSSEGAFEGSTNEILTSLNWLENDLKEANRNRKVRPWIIVLGHRPMYCTSFSSPTDGTCITETQTIREGLVDPATNTRQHGVEALLKKYKVDIYLCGHRHNFERTYPVYNGQVTSKSYHNAPSTFQYLVGNSGNYELTIPFNTTGPFPAWSASRYSGYGFSTVKATQHSLELTHYGVDNNGTHERVIDHVVVTKD
ncbi:hypothetical protein K450DRAFT_242849 [Umbelopsis ramanniana AG]|uniref:Purple acid phosphatase n=1 Tax=Umbelopsis ramanniana AG TaxID=1314678 RepID=A0AAD5HEU2_UMBRA|nr:uncharacterized protein K450DRAFT_242849 [Umbelopsis ramanniana AG]KAI8579348.1 hypothetical protein K450DRAFT_242849 [Umbelopsis ramanniana AG]